MKNVFLVAPSRSIPVEQMQATKCFLETRGFSVTAPKEMLNPDLFLSNNDEQRYFYLKKAFLDPKTDIVWSLAGGYGATRILPFLKKLKQPKEKKWFVGFSDSTAIHLFLNKVWNWPSIHGPGARQLLSQNKLSPLSPDSVEAILNQIKNPLIPSPHASRIIPFNDLAQKLPLLEGTVVGGNLALLQCSIGTFWQIQGKHRIILIEDVHERGYRIDRMLTHLSQAGVFHKAKAILLGDFIDGEEKDGQSFIEPVLERFSKSMQIPVFRIPHVGHGYKNFPIILNGKSQYFGSFSFSPSL